MEAWSAEALAAEDWGSAENAFVDESPTATELPLRLGAAVVEWTRCADVLRRALAAARETGTDDEEALPGKISPDAAKKPDAKKKAPPATSEDTTRLALVVLREVF